MNIGITGQSGFIGSYLTKHINYKKKEFKIIPFSRDFFDSKIKLNNFVKKVDVLIHLAGLNRHKSQNYIFEKNLELACKLVSSLESTNSCPHLIFASSTQESENNKYGRSKLECKVIFEDWSKKSKGKLSTLIIPNVFGPFCKPFYNSVVATFCDQIANNLKPKINIDKNVGLIYVGDLVEIIIDTCAKKNNSGSTITRFIDLSEKIKVSNLLKTLLDYKNLYCERGEIPDLSNDFKKNLFITFITYLKFEKFFPFNFIVNSDSRGSFTELMRSYSSGQTSFSITKPGITRGNHFHTRKVERFSVIKGIAKIEFRKINTKEKLSFILDGSLPSFVDMPVWYTHNITNIGDTDLYTLFWVDEFFNEDDPDTFFEQV